MNDHDYDINNSVTFSGEDGLIFTIILILLIINLELIF